MANGEVGRPTKYKPEYDNIAYLHCRKAGAHNEDLAELFSVDISTIYEWQNVYPTFSEALKKGKAEHDTTRVENALLNRALGCTVTETRINGGGDDDKAPASVQITKELPPDPVSCIFWLKNRDPNRWRDKVAQEIGLSNAVAPAVKIIRAAKKDD